VATGPSKSRTNAGVEPSSDTCDEVGGHKLTKSARVASRNDGEHSLKPRKLSGRTEEQNWAAVVEEVRTFVERLPKRKTQH
jgi:predicted alpha/beta-hydrolase family hydrolase